MADLKKLAALGALAADADGLSAEAVQEQRAADEQQAAQSQDKSAQQAAAEEWAMLPAMVGAMLAPYLPEVAPVYGKDSCLRWGAAMAAVAQKRGWDGVGSVPELVLVVATLSMAIPTVGAVRARTAAKPKPAAVAADPASVIGVGGAGNGGAS